MPRLTSGAFLHARLAALVAACGAAGCGGNSVAPPDGVPANVVCTDQRQPSLVSGWNTELSPDYVGLYQRTGPVGELGQAVLAESSGKACSGATVPEDCAALLGASEPEQGFNKSGQITVKDYFLYTAGDTVGSIGSLAELKNVLGPIDTANEAAVVLWAADRPVSCSDILVVEDGYLAHSSRALSDCPVTVQPIDVHVATDATLSQTDVGKPRVSQACAGRRPPGMRAGAGRGAARPAGDCLARIAQLELASVVAFTLLEQELEAHGAPLELRQRCRAAADDEARHARAVTTLSQRFGGAPGPVRVPQCGLRSVFELALENAREGEVRELYGATVAAWQAAHAADAGVAQIFAAIARDEADHAALAFDIGAWLDSRLSDAERAQVASEKRRALTQLRSELEAPLDAALSTNVGLPTAEQALSLLGALERELLAA